ncbi:MAG: iron-containing alcohol dehydrogenase [Rhodobacteraceae bacterium]|nr:iron-containing alcohol dehydrogenase [Paracoccaceae bacterium]
MTQNSLEMVAKAPPPGGWTALIDEIYLGRWRSPVDGALSPRSVTQKIVIQESLDGAEAELLRGIGVSGDLAVVADADTWAAMGARVFAACAVAGMAPREVVLEAGPHADLETAEALASRVRGAGHVVAVGSGTVNDLCKYVTAQDGRGCSVFGTAASMDGYTSSTASMSLPSGLKVSLKAQAPTGVFLDLGVIAAAPPRMAAAGFGDCLCSSVARIDWWLSHRLLATFFKEEPYLISAENDEIMNACVADIGRGELNAVGYLVRSLTLSGLGISFTQVSNHGSMSEHQISHYIDCFAREKHPGTLHGQQVGVASLTMAALQERILTDEVAPVLKPTRMDEADMARRMGPEIGAQCAEEYRKKALSSEGAAALNEKLAEIWPSLRAECLAIAAPVEIMRARLAAAGGATTAAELGLDRDFYREAIRHAHEMRNRFSFVDIACDAGWLDEFAAEAA